VPASLDRVRPLSQINIEETQARAKTYSKIVAEYSARYAAGDHFPRVVLFRATDDEYWWGTDTTEPRLRLPRA